MRDDLDPGPEQETPHQLAGLRVVELVLELVAQHPLPLLPALLAIQPLQRHRAALAAGLGLGADVAVDLGQRLLELQRRGMGAVQQRLDHALQELQEGLQVDIVRPLETRAVRGDAVQQLPGRMVLAPQQRRVGAGQPHDRDLQPAHQHLQRWLQAVVGQDLVVQAREQVGARRAGPGAQLGRRSGRRGAAGARLRHRRGQLGRAGVHQVQLERDLVQRRVLRWRFGDALELAQAQVRFLQRGAVAGEHAAQLRLPQALAQRGVDRLQLQRQRQRGHAHQRITALGIEVHALDRAGQRLREQRGPQRVVVLQRPGDAAQRGEEVAELVEFGTRLVLDGGDHVRDRDVLQRLAFVDQAQRQLPTASRLTLALQRIAAFARQAQQATQRAFEVGSEVGAPLGPSGQQLVVLQPALELVLQAVVDRMRQRGHVGEGLVDQALKGRRSGVGHRL